MANKDKPERLDYIEDDDGARCREASDAAAPVRAPVDFIDFRGEPIVPPRALPESRHWRNMQFVTTGEARNTWMRRVTTLLIQMAIITFIFFILLRNVHCRGFTL